MTARRSSFQCRTVSAFFISKSIRRCQSGKIRKAEIPALLTHTYQMTAKISRLGLTDGMVSFVIDHKDPDRQVMVPDGL